MNLSFQSRSASLALGALLCVSCADPAPAPQLLRATDRGASADIVPEAVLPDIIEVIPEHLQIQNDHQREWLRFSTTHLNIGEGNLQIRGSSTAPCDIDDGTGTIVHTQCTIATQEILNASGEVVATHAAGQALFHPEHNHWHQAGVAVFRIMQGNPDPLLGTEVANGVKITFCLVDVKTFSATGSLKKTYPRTYFECNGDLQGIAAHWGDEYHHSTPLQELEVTQLADGEYYLTHQADPENHWLESDESNNFVWVRFRLTRNGEGNRMVEVLDHSPCLIPAQCGFGGNP